MSHLTKQALLPTGGPRSCSVRTPEPLWLDGVCPEPTLAQGKAPAGVVHVPAAHRGRPGSQILPVTCQQLPALSPPLLFHSLFGGTHLVAVIVVCSFCSAALVTTLMQRSPVDDLVDFGCSQLLIFSDRAARRTRVPAAHLCIISPARPSGRAGSSSQGRASRGANSSMRWEHLPSCWKTLLRGLGKTAVTCLKLATGSGFEFRPVLLQSPLSAPAPSCDRRKSELSPCLSRSPGCLIFKSSSNVLWFLSRKSFIFGLRQLMRGQCILGNQDAWSKLYQISMLKPSDG